MDIGSILMESYVIYAVRHMNGTLESKEDLMEANLVLTFFSTKTAWIVLLKLDGLSSQQWPWYEKSVLELFLYEGNLHLQCRNSRTFFTTIFHVQWEGNCK